jgi:ribosomal protein S18 acetylase RimI-like enzyme
MSKIKKANIKDSVLIAKINHSSGDKIDKILGITEKWVANLFNNLIKDKNYEIYLYENSGVVALKKEFNGFNNCEIYWLTVDKKDHRKGIGKELLQFVENRAKKLKFKGIYIYTHPIHKVAIRFYKKMNYKKINEFPNYYSNGDKSILFGKVLR